MFSDLVRISNNSGSWLRLIFARATMTFSLSQAILLLGSAIDFYPLLCYSFYATCRELALPTGGSAAPGASGKSVNRIGELPLLAGFGGRLFHYQCGYVNTKGNGCNDKHQQLNDIICLHASHLLSELTAALHGHINMGAPICQPPILSFFKNSFPIFFRRFSPDTFAGKSILRSAVLPVIWVARGALFCAF